MRGVGNHGDDDTPFNEAQMLAAVDALASEANAIDENNPRQTADLIRKFTDMTGIPLNDTMSEALSRLESGEDPESIEQDLGSKLDALRTVNVVVSAPG